MLRSGDRVHLKIWREPDLSGDFDIAENRTVVIPMVGSLDVSEISVDSLKALLLSRYTENLRTPSVEITILRRINVLGSVRNAGLYYVDLTTTVADVLALAGGVTSEGKQNTVELIRGGTLRPVNLSRDSRLSDAPIESGDQLRVPQRSWASRNTAVITAALTSAAIVFAAALR